MSIWSILRGNKHIADKGNVISNTPKPISHDTCKYVFIDVEVGLKDQVIHDIGALRHDGLTFHKASKKELFEFIRDTEYICGHNIIHYDAKYLFENNNDHVLLVDTLYVSPLLFPERPYHKLLKEDKLVDDQLNNPLNDCIKAKNLLFDEISQWYSLSEIKRKIFASLLKGKEEFDGFLQMVGAESIEHNELSKLINLLYDKKICQHADLETLIYPLAELT